MRRWLWKRNGIQRVSGESKEILGRRSVRRISVCLVLGTVIEIHELCFTHFNNGDKEVHLEHRQYQLISGIQEPVIYFQ
jgi:hypothetical protein